VPSSTAGDARHSTWLPCGNFRCPCGNGSIYWCRRIVLGGLLIISEVAHLSQEKSYHSKRSYYLCFLSFGPAAVWLSLPDRHHYEKATKAATRYLKDLYSSEAQASGFLVMACYNWGVKIPDPGIRAAVELSVQYLPDRQLPDKALDRAGSRRQSAPPERMDIVVLPSACVITVVSPKMPVQESRLHTVP
jgi:AAA lid domain